VFWAPLLLACWCCLQTLGDLQNWDPSRGDEPPQALLPDGQVIAKMMKHQHVRCDSVAPHCMHASVPACEPLHMHCVGPCDVAGWRALLRLAMVVMEARRAGRRGAWDAGIVQGWCVACMSL
jgi:hypothetical protein